MAYQYYLVVSPADGHLYISDPERQQVLRALSLDSVREPSINSEPVVGSGERCIPGDEASCGDEGPALQARLSHPKGTIFFILNFNKYLLTNYSYCKLKDFVRFCSCILPFAPSITIYIIV